MIFKNARVVDVVRSRIYHGWFSVSNGVFEAVEEGKTFQKGEDLSGDFVVPCLVDSHMHVESSFLTPARFAEKALFHGTCAVLHDPHEMANVFGKDGVLAMIESSKDLPLRFYAAVPSCVPATRPPLDTPNATLSSKDVEDLLKLPRVLALGEVMDYRGLIEGNPELVEIVSVAREMGKPVEGHCPDLKGEELSRYFSFGIRSDHTLMNPGKILEELSKGVYVMIQEKSLTPENVELIGSIPDRSRILLVTDDVPPSRLTEGHLNLVVREAISLGWDAVDAIASATLRPAVYLNIQDLGCICPGKSASFFTTEEIEELKPRSVYIDGVSFDGKIDLAFDWSGFMRFDLPDLSLEDFEFDLSNGVHTFRIVRANPENTHTTLETEDIEVVNRFPRLKGDEIVVGVFGRKGGKSLGILKGLVLKEKCAFASTFSHDSHNLLVVGKNPKAMYDAYRNLVRIGGGMVLISGGERIELGLEIGGVITDRPVEYVAFEAREMEKTLNSCGFRHRNPLVFLTVLALTVSPEYKFSDRGIVDVLRREVLDPVIG